MRMIKLLHYPLRPKLSSTTLPVFAIFLSFLVLLFLVFSLLVLLFLGFSLLILLFLVFPLLVLLILLGFAPIKRFARFLWPAPRAIITIGDHTTGDL